jgi:hypothetical protein
MLRTTILLLVTFAVSQSALADNQAAFARILASPTEHEHVIAAAQRSTVVLNNPCVSAHFEMLDVVAVSTPPTFDSTGAIIGGAWKRVVREEGCGVSRTLNVLAVIQRPKTLVTMPIRQIASRGTHCGAAQTSLLCSPPRFFDFFASR